MTTYYKASKLKPQNREYYIISFRHPLIKETNGKTGKKIRRGLGTKDPIVADELVSQMNILLSDESYWSINSKMKAKDEFNEIIVNAFYDDIASITSEYSALRESIIKMKTPDEEYTRVLLLGATGSGKTTLLRQIMGTDPISERFPATSTAKTTVFDAEIILSDGIFKGIVTFYSESETRELVKESIKNAMSEYYITKNDKPAIRVFLEDKSQRFRLSYVLGKPKTEKYNKYEHNEKSDDTENEQLRVTSEEQKSYENLINELIDQIKKITIKISEQTKKEYFPDNEELNQEDTNLLEELTLNNIIDDDSDELLDLTDNIIDEIKLRFNLLNKDHVVFEKSGWIKYWSLETQNRKAFIDEIKYFSGNSSFLFGKLLTPLVSGMRVQGPFKPDFLSSIPKLAIIDGEGLGHIPDTTTNIPTRIIDKFEECEAIILVDDAQSPMQAAAYSVIKSSVISGHNLKLFICFTHFDLVEGDNLKGIGDKIDHISASVDNLISKLEQDFGYAVSKSLINNLFEKAVFLGNINERYRESREFDFMKDQLCAVINNLEKVLIPTKEISAIPYYELSPLILRLQNSAKKFHRIWNGYLGYTTEAGIHKAHFLTVKALTRRLGFTGENEFSYLRPISDFWTSFNEQISYFINNPIEWRPSNPTEVDKQKVLNELKQIISSKLLSYAKARIKDNSTSDWQVAFEFRGRGSSFVRADKINDIYDKTVPIPEEIISNEKAIFLKDVIKIIASAIKEMGGKVESILSV